MGRKARQSKIYSVDDYLAILDPQSEGNQPTRFITPSGQEDFASTIRGEAYAEPEPQTALQPPQTTALQQPQPEESLGVLEGAKRVIAPLPFMVGSSIGKMGGDAIRYTGDAINAGGNAIRSALGMPEGDINLLQSTGKDISDLYSGHQKQLEKDNDLSNHPNVAAVRSGLQSAGTMLATAPVAAAKYLSAVAGGATTMAAGAAAGNTALTAMSAQTGLDSYQRYADRGHGFTASTAGALSDFNSEYGTEKMENMAFFQYLADPQKAGLKALGKAVAKMGLVGQFTEQIATASQGVTDKIMGTPDMTLEEREQAVSDYFNKPVTPEGDTEWWRSVKDTAIATATMTGAMGAGGAVVKRFQSQPASTPDIDLTGGANTAPASGEPSAQENDDLIAAIRETRSNTPVVTAPAAVPVPQSVEPVAPEAAPVEETPVEEAPPAKPTLDDYKKRYADAHDEIVGLNDALSQAQTADEMKAIKQKLALAKARESASADNIKRLDALNPQTEGGDTNGMQGNEVSTQETGNGQGGQEGLLTPAQAEVSTAPPTPLPESAPAGVTPADVPSVQTETVPSEKAEPALPDVTTPEAVQDVAATVEETPVLTAGQQKFATARVKKLGSVDAVAAAYPDQTATLDRYANDLAVKLYGKGATPTVAPVGDLSLKTKSEIDEVSAQIKVLRDEAAIPSEATSVTPKAKKTVKTQAPAKPAKARNMLSDIQKSGGINLASLYNAIDRNEVTGPTGRGNRYLRVTGKNGVGIDQMAMQMKDQGWDIPVDHYGHVDTQAFADMLKDAVNGNLPVHPDNASSLAEQAYQEEAARREEELAELEAEAEALSEDELYDNIETALSDEEMGKALSFFDQFGGSDEIGTTSEPGTIGIEPTETDKGTQGDSGQERTKPQERSSAAIAEKQDKLFATPPTFGKKPQPKGAVNTDELPIAEASIQQREGKQGELEAPKTKMDTLRQRRKGLEELLADHKSNKAVLEEDDVEAYYSELEDIRKEVVKSKKESAAAVGLSVEAQGNGGEMMFMTAFARGTIQDKSVDRATLDKAVEKLSGFIGDTPIVVVESHTDLSPKAPKDAMGAYFEGKIYLVRSNIKSSEQAVASVLAHELTHQGLDRMGERGKVLLNQIAIAHAKDVKGIMTKRGWENTSENRMKGANELLAQHGETRLNPTLWAKIKDFVAGIITKITGEPGNQLLDQALNEIKGTAFVDKSKQSDKLSVVSDIFDTAKEEANAKGTKAYMGRAYSREQGKPLGKAATVIKAIHGSVLNGKAKDERRGLKQAEEIDYRNETTEEDVKAQLDAWEKSPYFSLASDGEETGLPEETAAQAGARKFQDKFNRIGVLQKWLDEQGVVLTDHANVSRKIHTMAGKIADQLKRFMDNQVAPLVKEASKAKVTLPDIEDYLLMQHAAEANAAMQKLHNDSKVTAFGVTDAKAEAKLEVYRARADFTELKNIADKFRQFSDDTASMLLKAGIITEEMKAAWDGAYQHYVPLRGAESDTKQGSGQGMRVNGKQQQRAGHLLRDEHVIENIIKMRELAVKAIEKNKVNLSLAYLVHQAGDDRIGTIDIPEKRRVFKNVTRHTVMYKGDPIAAFTNGKDADTFIEKDRAHGSKPLDDYAVHISSDPTVSWVTSPLLGNNEVNVYINGHQTRIQINDKIAANALTGLGAEHLGSILRVGKEINNWFARAYTGYDPRFTVRNTIRDFTAGMVNLTGDYGLGIASKIALNYPKAVKEFIKGRHDPTLSKWVNRYREQGGSTGATWLPSLERIGGDIENLYHEQVGAIATYKMMYAREKENGASDSLARIKATAKSGVSAFKKVPVLGHFLKLIEGLNAISENAFRVSTFMTLVQDGKSDAEAGEAAKNSTINFDKKGELGPQLSALYLFFNPAIQGMHRSVFALTQSKHKTQAQALVGSMALAGFSAAMWGLAAGGDGEWDKIQKSIKNRNLILFTGTKTYITIPLPYEYGAFVGIGYAMHDAMRGKFDKKLAINLAATILDGFSPIGNPVTDEGLTWKGVAQILPTVSKLLVAPGLNQNNFGSPIQPTKYSEVKPSSQNMYRGTKGSGYDTIASAINEATGGTKYSSGMLDVSPEVLKFYTRTILGGAFTFLDQVKDLSKLGINDTAPDIREMPMVNVLLRESSVQDARSAFWAIAGKANKAHAEWSAARKGNEPGTAADLQEKNKELLSVAYMADRSAKLAKAKRDAVDAIRLDDSLSFAAKRSQIKAIEGQEEAIYNRLINEFRIK